MYRITTRFENGNGKINTIDNLLLSNILEVNIALDDPLPSKM